MDYSKSGNPKGARGTLRAAAASFADRTALKRWAAPRELAGPALMLASEAGAYITGQGIVVDGGAAVNIL